MTKVQPPAFPFKCVKELGHAPGFEIDMQGWHSNHHYFAELIDEVKPQTIVEVGTWKGASAIHMASLISDANIYCVDTWLGGYEMLIHEDKPPHNLFRIHGYPHIYYQFLTNVMNTPYAERIFPIPQTSINGARLLRASNISAELIYVDGSHQLEDVYEDLRSYWTILKPGGVVFGDDWEMSGVEISVKRFALEMDMNLQIADNIFWTMRKPT